MKRQSNFLLYLIILFLIVISFQACKTKNTQLQNDPESKFAASLYSKAFNILKNDYIDPNHNGVDLSYWEHRYDNKLKTKEDAYVAIESMLESLNDKYTRFLPPEKYSEQDIDIESKISGIGVQIGEKDNKIYVVSVLEGTPAAHAQLKDNDIILSVDNISTKGRPLKFVADKIRGKIGTKVHIQVARNNKELDFDVTRDEIKIKSVFQKMLPGNISYIRLNSFISQEAGLEMEDAVLNSKKASAFIVDIRSNYGGLLPNAISISNIFLDKGSKIVSIVNQDGYKTDIKASENSLSQKPVILLINGSSASASEIFSGALKDNGRAVLVGEKTFGKGLVQKIFSLPDGSGINMTVSKYLTPKGFDINKKGIAPDIEVHLTIDDLRKGNDPQIEAAEKIAKEEIQGKTISLIYHKSK